MPTPTDLLQRYQRIVAEALPLASSEKVSLLADTDLVRIMIICDPQQPDINPSEVEMSLPSCIIDLPRRKQPIGADSFLTLSGI
jgi:hypothetical protein